MLKIIINDQQVDLEGVKFTLQLNSPIPFAPEDGLVEGSFAFGVAFPATPVNKKIFGFPHRLELYPNSPRDFRGLLYFDGRLLFKIVVSLTDVTDFSFKGNIKVGLGYFTNLIGEKTLRELAYEGLINLGTTTQDVVDHATVKVGQSYPGANYTFPKIKNPEFYGEENVSNINYLGYMNYYAKGSGFPLNYYDEIDIYNKYNLVPCFYLMHVLKSCFSEFSYNASGDLFKDLELGQLFIYNNLALDLIENRYLSRASLTADQAINGEAVIIFDLVDENIDEPYDNSTGKYLVKATGNHRTQCNLTLSHYAASPEYPGHWAVDVYLDEVLIQATGGDAEDSNPFEVAINFDYYLHDISLAKHIYVYVTLEDGIDSSPATGKVYAGAELQIQNISESKLNRYQKSITPADHMPDIKISEFLIRLQKLFGIIYDFDHLTRQVNVVFIADLLSQFAAAGYDVQAAKSSKSVKFNQDRSYKLEFNFPSSDAYTKDNFQTFPLSKLIGSYNSMQHLPQIAAEGAFALVKNINAYYNVVAGIWTWYADNFQPYFIGEGKTGIKPEVSPLTMSAEHDDFANYWYHDVMPRIKQKGSGQLMGENEYGFHLLFYRGMQEDNIGRSYPFASCTMYSPTGDIIANYELRWDGDNGLYKKFLEKYFDFAINRTRPVEYERYFNASEIQAIDFLTKKRMFQQDYFLDEVSIPLSNTSIGVASMKLQKI